LSLEGFFQKIREYSGGSAIELNAYNDFDAFSKDARFIVAGMLPKDTERSTWTNSHIELGGVHVQIGSLGSGYIIEGRSSPDGYLVYVPLTGAGEHTANGIVLDELSVLVLEPGSDFCLSVGGPHKACSIFVPTGKLTRYRSDQRISADNENPRCGAVRITGQSAGQLRHFIHEVESAASSVSNFEFTPAAKAAAEEAVGFVHLILMEGQDAGPQFTGRPRISRQEIIRRSIALLEERGNRHIRVADMASRAGVSERTLQTAFREYFGVGPARYMQLRRLRRVNIALQAAQPDRDTVAEILLREGELQFGRFAERYRRLFGELPSQTLQRDDCA
jgi:AraC family ethanolamine operon transcriptional activator